MDVEKVLVTIDNDDEFKELAERAGYTVAQLKEAAIAFSEAVETVTEKTQKVFEALAAVLADYEANKACKQAEESIPPMWVDHQPWKRDRRLSNGPPAKMQRLSHRQVGRKKRRF